MNAEQFCQWLQECLDILETKTLNTKQVEMIKEKLATVNGHEKILKTIANIHDFKYPPSIHVPPNITYDNTNSVSFGYNSYSTVGTYLMPNEYNISGTWNHNVPSTISSVKHSNQFPVSKW